MEPGELVADRFEVSDCVGAGRHGAVYRAWDRVLEREVAIKQLACSIDERVMRTSRAAARLNHPAIVALFEVGETKEGAFLVSEFIDGLTLRQAHERGLLTDRDVAEIGADLCDALHHAHERGIFHGDIKPENVIVRTREANPDQRSGRCQANLRDFATREITGGVESTISGRESLTAEGEYLTPDQLNGGEPGASCDVFAVGLVLFECWTGANPLAGGYDEHKTPMLSDFRPDLPGRLGEIVGQALGPDPRRRPQALELREWLDHVFDDLDAQLAVPERTSSPAARPPRRAVSLLALSAGAAGVACAYLATTAFDRAASDQSLWVLVPIAVAAASVIAATIAMARLITRVQAKAEAFSVHLRSAARIRAPDLISHEAVVRASGPEPVAPEFASTVPPDPEEGALIITARAGDLLGTDPVRSVHVP